MPVTESDELGVNILGRQSSDSIAGVPIKKRRFPLVSSPSAPPRASSPLHAGLHQSQKGCSKSGVESSKTCSQWQDLGNTIIRQDCHRENREERLVGTNVNLISDSRDSRDLKNEESISNQDQPAVSVGVSGILIPEVAACPSDTEKQASTDKAGDEGKLVVDDKSSYANALGNPDLIPAEEEPSPLSIKGQISEERMGRRFSDAGLNRKSRSNSPIDKSLGRHESGNDVLLKDLAFAASGCNTKVDGKGEITENPSAGLCSPEKNLLLNENALGKGEESEVDCTARENRSHWDLNTVMESWEGTASHDGLDEAAMHSKNQAHEHSCLMDIDIKEPEDTCTTAEKKTVDGELSKFSLVNGEHYTSDSALHLQLSPLGSLIKHDSKEELSDSDRILSVKRDSSIGCELSPDGKHEGEDNHPDNRCVIDESATYPVNSSGLDMIVSETVDEVEKVLDAVVCGVKESPIAADAIDISKADDGNCKSSEITSFNDVCEAVSSPSVIADSYANSETSESYDEKIDISADILEEDPYDSDYESDGSQDVGPVMETETKQQDDEFEDGEFREYMMHSSVDGMCDEGETEHVDYGYSDNKEACGSGDDHVSVSLHAKGMDSTKKENSKETEDTHYAGDKSIVPCIEKSDQNISVRPCLQEPSVTDASSSGSGKQLSITSDRKFPRDSNHSETELESDRAGGAARDSITNDGQGSVMSQLEPVKRSDSVEGKQPACQKVECPTGSLNSDEANVDVNGRGDKSRIISLVRPAHRWLPERGGSIPGRVLSLPKERERFAPDISLRGSKLHPQGDRGESCIDTPRKFDRGGNPERPVGSFGYMRGRGRGDKELDTSRGSWGPDRHYSSDNYDSPTGFRFSGSKNAAAVAAAKIECSGFVVAPDGTIVKPEHTGRGAGRVMRKSSQSFHNSPPRRRRSPDGGEGCMPFGIHLGRRPQRDMSPGNREFREFGPDMVVMRHNEKFRRGLPDDMIDPSFSHPQFERPDGNFVRKDGSFSPIRRRNPMHLRRPFSKSPPRSKSPSPRSWAASPPRRRSADGFNGHLDPPQRRSPPIFRLERRRSPRQRPYFEEDMMGLDSSSRRHGSPPYISRFPDDMREVDPAREHVRNRPFVSNRGPPGRPLQKSRTFIDPRERMDAWERMETRERMGGEECYRPMRSNEFHEFRGEGRGMRRDGCVDERRKFAERRGPGRSFRPYDGPDEEGFSYHGEDDPRPFDFCPEVGPQVHRRSGSRDFEVHRRSGSRDFDGRIRNNRFGNIPRKPRNVEEQEDNYRYGGHGWNNDGFDDVAPMKRRRFS